MRSAVCVSLLLGVAFAGSGCSSDDSKSAPADTTRPTAPATSTTPTTTGFSDKGLRLVRKIAPDDGYGLPSFVEVDAAHDRVIVTDSDKGRVLSFALDGSDPKVIRAGSEDFDFSDHGSLGSADAAADGSLFVAESGTKRVVHVDDTGRVLGTIEGEPFSRLFSASVDTKNSLVYAVDDERDVIVVFDASGNAVRRIGAPGETPGKLSDPGSVEVLDDGTLWIADAGNSRAQHLSPTGQVLQTIGPFETGAPGNVEYPNDVAVDAKGRVWVADHRGKGLTAYNTDGTALGRFGLPLLGKPLSLAFDPSGRLYVAEENGNTVYTFDVLV